VPLTCKWRVERAGLVAMALVIVAALTGLTGGGPLSRAQARTADGRLTLEYERFMRWDAPAPLRLRFDASAADGGEIRVWLDRGYLRDVKIERVVPEPQKVQLGAGRVTYVFPSAGGSAGDTVTMYVEPQSVGAVSLRAGLAGGRALAARQLVYP
jgi:hypothetical protein